MSIDIDWWDLVLGAVLSILVLAMVVILVAGIHYEASLGTSGFGAWLRRLNNPIAYRPRKRQREVPTSPMVPTYYSANVKANHLLQTTLGLTGEQIQAMQEGKARITVIGGATGRRYEISPRFNLPIHVPDERLYLCAGPFNGHALPFADIVLSQALYLSCPTTERDFLRLCNKTQFV